MSHSNVIARRVCLQQQVGRTISGIAAARAGNGTQPDDPIGWMSILSDRMLEISADMHVGMTNANVDRGRLIALAADVQAWIEQIDEQEAA